MEQKDIKQQQTQVRGHLQVGEHACSSASAVAHFKRVAYTLGRTGKSDKRDMELQGGAKAHPETSAHNSASQCAQCHQPQAVARPSGEGSWRQQGFRVAITCCQAHYVKEHQV